MAKKHVLSRSERQVILDARNLISQVEKVDANEAETRRRVERIFERVMGYDVLAHLSRERAVRGAGDTEHVDFALQLDPGPDQQPVMMVELKRVGLDLARKHLKQASRYAIDAGCEWVLLTNGREWQLHHVEFGQPPNTKMVDHWNLLSDAPEVLARKFERISLKSIRRGALDTLWERTKVLAPQSLLRAILSRPSLNALRRALKNDTGVAVPADHIVTALRRMLNESAAAILDDIDITLPVDKPAGGGRGRKKTAKRGKLTPLIEAGLIDPGATLVGAYKGTEYQATVESDGTLRFDGKAYGSPSAAAVAIVSKHGLRSWNGWTFWKSTSADGEARYLDDLRRELHETEEDASA